MLVLRLIPKQVMQDAHRQAESAIAAGERKPVSRFAVWVIISSWILAAALIVWMLGKKATPQVAQVPPSQAAASFPKSS